MNIVYFYVGNKERVMEFYITKEKAECLPRIVLHLILYNLSIESITLFGEKCRNCYICHTTNELETLRKDWLVNNAVIGFEYVMGTHVSIYLDKLSEIKPKLIHLIYSSKGKDMLSWIETNNIDSFISVFSGIDQYFSLYDGEVDVINSRLNILKAIYYKEDGISLIWNNDIKIISYCRDSKTVVLGGMGDVYFDTLSHKPYLEIEHKLSKYIKYNDYYLKSLFNINKNSVISIKILKEDKQRENMFLTPASMKRLVKTGVLINFKTLDINLIEKECAKLIFLYKPINVYIELFVNKDFVLQKCVISMIKDMNSQYEVVKEYYA